MGNRNPEVDAWFESYENPQKNLVQAVRDVILDTDPRVTEAIKWKAPTFIYAGNIASFYPKSRKHVSLLFHTGASLPGPRRTPRRRGRHLASGALRQCRGPASQDARPSGADRGLDRVEGLSRLCSRVRRLSDGA